MKWVRAAVLALCVAALLICGGTVNKYVEVMAAIKAFNELVERGTGYLEATVTGPDEVTVTGSVKGSCPSFDLNSIQKVIWKATLIDDLSRIGYCAMNINCDIEFSQGTHIQNIVIYAYEDVSISGGTIEKSEIVCYGELRVTGGTVSGNIQANCIGMVVSGGTVEGIANDKIVASQLLITGGTVIGRLFGYDSVRIMGGEICAKWIRSQEAVYIGGDTILNVEEGIRAPKVHVEPSVKKIEKPKHIVEQGDTLWDLARHYLGDGTRWIEIQNANGIAPDWLRPGMEIIIPDF